MDKEREEDGEAERGIGVVCGVRNEPLGDFVESYGSAGLQANGEEDIVRNVVMVLLSLVIMIVVVVVRVGVC